MAHPRDQYDRDDALETHAYELIHTTLPEEIFKMKFDLFVPKSAISVSDGGAQAARNADLPQIY